AFLAKPIEARRLLDEVQGIAAERRERRSNAGARGVATPRGATSDEPPVINLETLRHLQDLGSSPAFMTKLCAVFFADNTVLLNRMESAIAARNYGELRSHVHALKGSAASMGTDRLTQFCSKFDGCSDAELRLQGAKLLRSLGKELAAARHALEEGAGGDEGGHAAHALAGVKALDAYLFELVRTEARQHMPNVMRLAHALPQELHAIARRSCFRVVVDTQIVRLHVPRIGAAQRVRRQLGELVQVVAFCAVAALPQGLERARAERIWIASEPAFAFGDVVLRVADHEHVFGGLRIARQP